MITYFLGAGASFNSIPVVADISEKIQELMKSLRSVDFFGREVRTSGGKYDQYSAQSLVEGTCNLLISLFQVAKSYHSIDTYAKQLYLRGLEKELKDYKALLGFWLTVTQIVNPIDKRYQIFLATLIKDHSLLLPKDVQIFTWNYDIQLELAMAEYFNPTKLSNFNEVVQKNGLASRKNAVLNFTQTRENKSSQIIKFNGSCALQRKVIPSPIRYFFSEPDPFKKLTRLEQCIETYQKCLRGEEEFEISFAWEKDNNTDYLINVVKERLGSAQAIVVIGYSFPTFNREIDQQFFNEMSLPTDCKIFIQDPNGEEIADKIKMNFGIQSGRIKVLSPRNIHEFFIPNFPTQDFSFF